jgi:D-lactate dehydrogenase
MKIVFFEVPKMFQDVFLNSFPNLDVSFCEEKLNENNADIAKDADIVSIFVDSNLNKNAIDKMINLKFIATRSTGFSHIDYEYAFTKGINISNVPAYGSHTVAEFAFGLILNLSRNILKINTYLKDTLDYKYLPWMEGFNLEGKTLGVVGTGKIGKNVIKIAKGFEMNVIAYDLYPDLEFAKENNFSYKTLDEVTAEADILTLHTPYTKENYHMINKDNISKMKKGVYIINTARGELVDTEALVFGLKEKIIAGVGLDLLESSEDLTTLNNEIVKMPNVIVTPHIAFYTREATMSIMNTSIENIKGFIDNNPINLIK